jgi:hypothetical protein
MGTKSASTILRAVLDWNAFNRFYKAINRSLLPRYDTNSMGKRRRAKTNGRDAKKPHETGPDRRN